MTGRLPASNIGRASPLDPQTRGTLLHPDRNTRDAEDHDRHAEDRSEDAIDQSEDFVPVQQIGPLGDRIGGKAEPGMPRRSLRRRLETATVYCCCRHNRGR